MSFIKRILEHIHFSIGDRQKILKWKGAYYPAEKLAASFLIKSEKFTNLNHHSEYLKLCKNQRLVPKGDDNKNTSYNK